MISSFLEFLNLTDNFMLELPESGLTVERLMYRESIDSTVEPDPSLIQFSILYKIS